MSPLHGTKIFKAASHSSKHMPKLGKLNHRLVTLHSAHAISKTSSSILFQPKRELNGPVYFAGAAIWLTGSRLGLYIMIAAIIMD